MTMKFVQLVRTIDLTATIISRFANLEYICLSTYLTIWYIGKWKQYRADHSCPYYSTRAGMLEYALSKRGQCKNRTVLFRIMHIFYPNANKMTIDHPNTFLKKVNCILLILKIH